jgi:CRISPR-associated endonuclease/helicase Cas3
MHQPRWLHIKAGGASGYPVAITGLSEADSLMLQQIGLGGRRRMGCGVMIPYFC